MFSVCTLLGLSEDILNNTGSSTDKKVLARGVWSPTLQEKPTEPCDKSSYGTSIGYVLASFHCDASSINCKETNWNFDELPLLVFFPEWADKVEAEKYPSPELLTTGEQIEEIIKWRI